MYQSKNNYATVFATLIFCAGSLLPLMAQQPSTTPQILSALKGLTFLPDRADFQQTGISNPGLDTTRVAMLEDDQFRDHLAARIGKPLTIDGLLQITHEVTEFYRSHNHPLVDVTVPPQEMPSGVIQILVTEFRVGEVRAEGNNWFSDRSITAPLDFKHGDFVNSERLMADLDAVNSNPFRHVDLVYAPSSDKGYTDLVLKTKDRLPLRAFATFDNSGVPTTGRSRWGLGVTWGNAFWHDQQLTYLFSASDNFFTGNSPLGQPGGANFLGHTLTWSMPVLARDSVSIMGMYVRTVPNLGQDFGLVGINGQASIRYNHALPRTKRLSQTAFIGYDFKTTNNNLQFGGTSISRNNVEIDQFPLGYTGNLTDRWGVSALTSTVIFSPGRLTPDNSPNAFQPAIGQLGRDFVAARYIYWRSDFTRLTKLPMEATWASRFLGQTSTNNLFYTEQLAGGGPEIMRGYDPNSILGDKGVVLSNELRTPQFFKNTEMNLGQVQFLAFWDWAHMSSVHNAEGAINHLNASSAGMGCRYNFRTNMSANFDYGWQLQHLPNADGRDHLANFSLMIGY